MHDAAIRGIVAPMESPLGSRPDYAPTRNLPRRVLVPAGAISPRIVGVPSTVGNEGVALGSTTRAQLEKDRAGRRQNSLLPT